MPQRRRLTDMERGMAIAWLQEDIGVREIGRRLRVSHSVIQTLRDRFNATGSVAERRRQGRPRSTTRQQDRYVVLSALRNRSASANTIRGDLQAAGNVNVSDQTIRNRLREVGLHSRRSAVRQTLSAAHRRARLIWAEAHVTWTRQQWASVLFSDESRFTISFNDGRIHVWRRRGERYQDATITQRDRFGGGSVMVWGGMAFRQRTILHRVHGILNAIRYRDEILQPIVQPALEVIGEGAVFQDDNARPHRAHIVTDFLQQHNIMRMEWPSCSPDLNPIEHLWDVLGRRLRSNHPPAVNLNQLHEFLQQEWERIPQMTLQTLVNSMRQRCIQCIQAHGGHTRY